MPARSIVLTHILHPRDTNLSLKMTKKTPALSHSEIRGAFPNPRQAIKALCKKLTNSSNPALADGIYLVTTLLAHGGVPGACRRGYV